jgi:hypothetical protein
MYDIQVGPNECGQELVSKGRGTIWIGQDPTVSILQKLVCQIRNRVIIITSLMPVRCTVRWNTKPYKSKPYKLKLRISKLSNLRYMELRQQSQ